MNVRPKVDMERASLMWADDATVGEIADFFGVTRNTVSGIMNRHRKLFPKKTDGEMDLNPNGQKGGPGRPRGERKKYTRINTQNIHKARQDAARREAGDFNAGASPLLQIAPSDADRLDMVRCKDLMDLAANECRWPLGKVSPFKFCADRTDGDTYCTHHARRAYRARVE